ncbi:[Pyruvate dehydrogenase (acetyl-transferring)] kinase isozyme 2 [Coemansia sp. RSA 1722]|nr:[Pyruvate dehydrogenase (acetyl-transferring)] kinase isozyme 2 [Coemansia sp. RSA 485]KAJ2598110.1 [Pyruvate dehydrogenase (acetyl-transferring)] kinase isozyme 2 [Coemansia sp. RSA 1722]
MGTQAPKDLFRRFASKEMTKLTLSQYYTAGRHLLKHRNSGGDARFSAFQLTAKFLHRELPVRMGQTVSGLKHSPSPYNIRQMGRFRQLMDNYADDFALLVDRTPAPTTPKATAEFVEALRKLKGRYRVNMWMLSQALRELSSAINSNDPRIVPDFLLPGAAEHRRVADRRAPLHYYSSTLAYPDLSAPMAYLAPSGKMEMTDPATWSQLSGPPAAGCSAAATTPHQWTPNRVCSEFCDETSCRNPRLWPGDNTLRCAENQTRRFFDWLYSMNLGTQLLIEDHVAIHDYGHNLVQIIQPLEIANRAAHDASVICQRHYGFAAPVINVIAPTPGVTTTYVPHHLYSMLFQLLKNALRATIEHHQAQASRARMPVVKLVMSSGDEDVAFKVSDEGGGIPLSQVDAIWSYLKTTSDPASVASEPKNAALSSITFMNRNSDMPLFGAGDGLPMTRQIARYFGGDLDLVSMEGVGTDAYLHLSRSRNAIEHTADLSTLLHSSVSDMMGFSPDVSDAASPSSSASSGLV